MKFDGKIGNRRNVPSRTIYKQQWPRTLVLTQAKIGPFDELRAGFEWAARPYVVLSKKQIPRAKTALRNDKGLGYSQGDGIQSVA